MRDMEDADSQYSNILGQKFPKTDGIGLIQVYRRELREKLADCRHSGYRGKSNSSMM